MRSMLLLWILLAFAGKLNAQGVWIRIDFSKENKKMLYTKMAIFVSQTGNRYNFDIKNNSFFFPDSLQLKKRTFTIDIDSYSFVFENTIMEVNGENACWNLSLDFKPLFGYNKCYSIVNDKKVKYLYSLEYNTGRRLVFYRFNKMRKKKRSING